MKTKSKESKMKKYLKVINRQFSTGELVELNTAPHLGMVDGIDYFELLTANNSTDPHIPKSKQDGNQFLAVGSCITRPLIYGPFDGNDDLAPLGEYARREAQEWAIFSITKSSTPSLSPIAQTNTVVAASERAAVMHFLCLPHDFDCEASIAWAKSELSNPESDIKFWEPFETYDSSWILTEIENLAHNNQQMIEFQLAHVNEVRNQLCEKNLSTFINGPKVFGDKIESIEVCSIIHDVETSARLAFKGETPEYFAVYAREYVAMGAREFEPSSTCADFVEEFPSIETAILLAQKLSTHYNVPLHFRIA
jgi:hypothetical protein